MHVVRGIDTIVGIGLHAVTATSFLSLRQLAREVGFGAVCRVPLENPFNILYVLRATAR